MNHQKVYAGFAKDQSSSMGGLRTAAIADYNNTIGSITGAASREVLDTIVAVVGFGSRVERQIVNSNPHVLKPLTSWIASGNTALYDAIGDLIEQFEAVPDYSNPNVSFIVSATTDGEENNSRNYNASSLRGKIEALQNTGRWTFVLRVPKGAKSYVSNLGIPAGNIQEWETTVEGMAKATAETTQAFDQYYATRATGQKSSTVFYAQAGAVDTSQLVDITSKVSLYKVEDHENRMEIMPFILKRRMQYLKGAAFYQLMKTEPRVQPDKLIAVRDRTTLKIYAGADARKMLGLPTDRNVRLHPGDHGNFDIFIQSKSINRHLVAGYGVLYWEAQGVPLTDADLNFGKPKAAGPVILPAVAPTNKPTPNPLKVAKAAPLVPQAVRAPAHGIAVPPATPVLSNAAKPVAQPAVNGRVRYHYPTANAKFYSTRDIAREVAHTMPGNKQYDAGPTAAYGRRFFVAAA